MTSLDLFVRSTKYNLPSTYVIRRVNPSLGLGARSSARPAAVDISARCSRTRCAHTGNSVPKRRTRPTLFECLGHTAALQRYRPNKNVLPEVSDANLATTRDELQSQKKKEDVFVYAAAVIYPLNVRVHQHKGTLKSGTAESQSKYMNATRCRNKMM